jgi:hypothetical protein
MSTSHNRSHKPQWHVAFFAVVHKTRMVNVTAMESVLISKPPIMVRKQVRAKVSVFEVHKPETHHIPAITIHHNKGQLGQQSDSVKSTRESRTTSQPIRDENVMGLEAAIAEDAHDFELPASVDTEDDPPTKVSSVPSTLNLY